MFIYSHVYRLHKQSRVTSEGPWKKTLTVLQMKNWTTKRREGYCFRSCTWTETICCWSPRWWVWLCFKRRLFTASGCVGSRCPPPQKCFSAPPGGSNVIYGGAVACGDCAEVKTFHAEALLCVVWSIQIINQTLCVKAVEQSLEFMTLEFTKSGGASLCSYVSCRWHGMEQLIKVIARHLQSSRWRSG